VVVVEAPLARARLLAHLEPVCSAELLILRVRERHDGAVQWSGVAGDALSVHFTAARATNGAALRGDDVVGKSGAFPNILALIDAGHQAPHGRCLLVAAI
jgi:hypothetical protein